MFARRYCSRMLARLTLLVLLAGAANTAWAQNTITVNSIDDTEADLVRMQSESFSQVRRMTLVK